MILDNLTAAGPSPSPDLNLITLYGGRGRSQIWTSEWVGVVCCTPSRLMVALPAEFGKGVRSAGPGAFALNLSPGCHELSDEVLPLLMGDAPEGLAERGIHLAPARLARTPLILEAPVSIECRTVSARNRFRQTVLTGEVLGVHLDGRFHSGDRYLNLCHLNPFGRVRSWEYGDTRLVSNHNPQRF